MKNIMKKVYPITILELMLLIQIGLAFNARIVQLTGDVKFRQGVEETWQLAKPGTLLQDIDTIVTGEDGVVVLETEDGRRFKMEHYTMIDIADLRRISEKDLFISLMKEKVNTLENRDGKTPLRIGTVSVVHGTSQDTQQVAPSPESFLNQELVKNGIRALYQQEYYPNTILKVHQYFAHFPSPNDCGELNYYLGSSFQELNQAGQAMDAYRKALQSGQVEGCSDQQWENLSRNRLEELEKNHK